MVTIQTDSYDQFKTVVSMLSKSHHIHVVYTLNDSAFSAIAFTSTDSAVVALKLELKPSTFDKDFIGSQQVSGIAWN